MLLTGAEIMVCKGYSLCDVMAGLAMFSNSPGDGT